MKHAMLVAAFVLAFVPGSVVQVGTAQKPSFAGKWVIDAERTAAAAKDGAAYPNTEIEIVMDEKTMSVASKGPRGEVKNVYNLNGSPSSTGSARAVGPSGGQGRAVTSTASWQESSLIISTKLYNGSATLKYTREGDFLRVEYLAPEVPPRRAVYRKAQLSEGSVLGRGAV